MLNTIGNLQSENNSNNNFDSFKFEDTIAEVQHYLQKCELGSIVTILLKGEIAAPDHYHPSRK
jgi:hypothetical protein